MRRSLSWILVSMLLAGCGSAGGPASKQAYQSASGGATAEPPLPIPPRDALWTIYCMSIASPDHVNVARRMRSTLAGSTTMKDWYVVHTDDQSVLYYGYYRTINDPKDRAETERAQKDRATLDALKDSRGARPFDKAVFVEIDQADPTAPSEWDLTNAKGYYTLQIAAFKDNVKRKEAAVQAVRDFRDKGIEAYFYHGPSASIVSIGTWPIEAIRTDGNEVRANDPNEEVLVAPNMSEKQIQELEKRTKRTVRRNKSEPLDPTLLAMMRQYPELSVNYEVKHTRKVNPETGKVIEDYDHSFVVKIPRRAGGQTGILNAGREGTSAGPSLLAPTRSNDPRNTGRLRSFGD